LFGTSSNLDALEAQDGGGVRKSDTPRVVREWLGAVEGGVGRVVEKVVRWTGEGEEKLLLPVEEGGL